MSTRATCSPGAPQQRLALSSSCSSAEVAGRQASGALGRVGHHRAGGRCPRAAAVVGTMPMPPPPSAAATGRRAARRAREQWRRAGARRRGGGWAARRAGLCTRVCLLLDGGAEAHRWPSSAGDRCSILSATMMRRAMRRLLATFSVQAAIRALVVLRGPVDQGVEARARAAFSALRDRHQHVAPSARAIHVAGDRLQAVAQRCRSSGAPSRPSAACASRACRPRRSPAASPRELGHHRRAPGHLQHLAERGRADAFVAPTGPSRSRAPAAPRNVPMRSRAPLAQRAARGLEGAAVLLRRGRGSGTAAAPSRCCCTC